MAGRAILESHSSTSKFYGHDEKIEKKIMFQTRQEIIISYVSICVNKSNF